MDRLTGRRVLLLMPCHAKTVTLFLGIIFSSWRGSRWGRSKRHKRSGPPWELTPQCQHNCIKLQLRNSTPTNPMQATVYRLREQGIKLPRPASPRFGEVLLAKVDRGDNKVPQARLVDGSKDLLPPLFGALITRVTKNGMVIQGMEMSSRVPGSSKAKVSTHRQTWWVMVMCNTVDGLDVLEEMANGENPLIPCTYPDGMPPHWQRAQGT